MSKAAEQILAKHFDYKRQNYRVYYDDTTEEITSREFFERYTGSGVSGDGFRAIYDVSDPWRVAFITVFSRYIL